MAQVSMISFRKRSRYNRRSWFHISSKTGPRIEGNFGSMDRLEMILVTCDEHLLSGVTIRPSYTRSNEDFLFISEDAAKHYNLQSEPIC